MSQVLSDEEVRRICISDVGGYEQARAIEAAILAKLADKLMLWRPIETAPKDGTMFLCWVEAVRYGETDEGQQFQQDVSQCDECWWRPDFQGVPDSGYFDNACGQVGDSQAVTHWMPLPPAPAIDAQKGKPWSCLLT